MSTLFWKALKLSPALLGASLLFASSAYAQKSASEQKVTDSTEVAVVPATDQSQTQVVAISTTAAPITSEQPEAIAPNPAEVTLESSVEPSTELFQNPVTETKISRLTSSEGNAQENSADNTLAQQLPAAGNITSDSTEVLQQIEQYQRDNGGTGVNTLDQVTNVNQLSDVRPTDWAFEALRSLVERYGCIAGYPDGTFRGNRAMTRYEFAAGLNACLQQIERLIATGPGDFVTRPDLVTLQRLVDEFRAELTTLGTRVDALEGRVAFLEDRQFSTTTKLNAEIIFAFTDIFGEDGNNIRGIDYADNTVLQNRVRLNFDTSFTGRDRLRTRLEAGNFTPFAVNSGAFNALTREGRLGFETNTGNNVEIGKLWYRAPLGDALTFHLFANDGGFDDIAPVLNPLEPSGTGALSRFGRFNPIYRIGAGGAGAGLTFGARSPIRVDVGYLARRANDPSEKRGLFDGNYSALGQITFQPSPAFNIAATYVHSYDNSEGAVRDQDNVVLVGAGGSLLHGTGSLASQVRAGRPVVSNSYGLQASFAFSPRFILSGWAGKTDATVIGTGKADVWNYGATLALRDIGTPGSTLGFIVGMEPKLTGTSGPLVADAIFGAIDPGAGRRRDRDTSLHVEGFYRFNLTRNISLTPGVIWLTNPGHDSRNEDIFIGTLRTTFTF